MSTNDTDCAQLLCDALRADDLDDEALRKEYMSIQIMMGRAKDHEEMTVLVRSIRQYLISLCREHELPPALLDVDVEAIVNDTASTSNHIPRDGRGSRDTSETSDTSKTSELSETSQPLLVDRDELSPSPCSGRSSKIQQHHTTTASPSESTHRTLSHTGSSPYDATEYHEGSLTLITPLDRANSLARHSKSAGPQTSLVELEDGLQNVTWPQSVGHKHRWFRLSKARIVNLCHIWTTRAMGPQAAVIHRSILAMAARKHKTRAAKRGQTYKLAYSLSADTNLTEEERTTFTALAQIVLYQDEKDVYARLMLKYWCASFYDALIKLKARCATDPVTKARVVPNDSSPDSVATLSPLFAHCAAATKLPDCQLPAIITWSQIWHVVVRYMGPGILTALPANPLSSLPLLHCNVIERILLTMVEAVPEIRQWSITVGDLILTPLLHDHQPTLEQLAKVYVSPTDDTESWSELYRHSFTHWTVSVPHELRVSIPLSIHPTSNDAA